MEAAVMASPDNPSLQKAVASGEGDNNPMGADAARQWIDAPFTGAADNLESPCHRGLT